MASNRSSDVHFSPDQLKYLEAVFPAIVLPSTTPEAAVRQYFGTQAVLQVIREKTRGISAQNIPAPR